jgi:thiol-disulfide isomerase/thioredoxin
VPTRKYSNADLAGLLILLVVVGLVVWRLAPQLDPPVALGAPLPAFNVEGWLNVPEGQAFDAAGELVVVDCWATWCGTCRADMPQLAMIAADYRKRGVKFVGLTQETSADLPLIRSAIAATPGFDWPVGFGATEFMGRLNIGGFPTVVLFGRDGKVRWSERGSYGLEGALDKALAEKPDAAKTSGPKS